MDSDYTANTSTRESLNSSENIADLFKNQIKSTHPLVPWLWMPLFCGIPSDTWRHSDKNRFLQPNFQPYIHPDSRLFFSHSIIALDPSDLSPGVYRSDPPPPLLVSDPRRNRYLCRITRPGRSSTSALHLPISPPGGVSSVNAPTASTYTCLATP